MANTSSAKIANRKDIRRTEINRMRITRVRTFLKKVETAVAKGDHKLAMAALRTAESELNSGVTKNLFKKKMAARKVSRLNARVKALLNNPPKPASKTPAKAASKTPKAKKSA